MLDARTCDAGCTYVQVPMHVREMSDARTCVVKWTYVRFLYKKRIKHDGHSSATERGVPSFEM